MSIFSKILQSTSKNIAKAIHKEQRGIYNVTYNGKIATYIKTDLDSIDNAIRYARGDRNKGAQHIKLGHTLDEKQEGYITQQELLNIGKNIREYLAKHKMPFIDKNGGRIYEWSNDKGENFRVVSHKGFGIGGGETNPAITTTTDTEHIITFYSDRNLQNGKVFEFKNPKLQDSTQNLLKSSSLTNNKLPPKTPPMMRE